VGYTSYWNTKKLTKEDKAGYLQALPIVQDILKRYKDIIQYEHDTAKPVVASKKEIRFNGIADNGHETFYFKPTKFQSPAGYGDRSFAFCKTARKPYDVVVCEVLLVLKRFMPNLEVSSDGFSGYLKEPKLDGAWPEAIENLRNLYGIKYNMVVTNEREPYCDMEPVLVKEEETAPANA
jgi:hypothetical protein